MFTYEHLRYLHVVVGSVALIAACAALIVKKGGGAHRAFGKAFVISMTVVFVTAVTMSTLLGRPFLVLLGVTSYYGVVSGYRSLYLKQLHDGRGVRRFDWTAAIVALLINLAFVGYGVFRVVTYFDRPIIARPAGLAIFFALMGSGFVLGNIVRFVRPPASRTQWLFSHFGGMLFGLIGGVTAFSIQVMTFLPTMVRWTWAVGVGSALIGSLTLYFRRQLAGGAALDDLVRLTPAAPTDDPPPSRFHAAT
jgi:hypothetical protein